jgi:hypothetical protein
MQKSCALAAVVLLAVSAHAQTILYDTFNEADQGDLFDCCRSLLVSGKKAPPGRGAVAVPFTPDGNARITEVDVALSDINGDGSGDRMRVEVAGNALGLPGRVKHSFLVTSPPPAGQCCRFISEEAKGIPIKAGGHYWIAIKPVGANTFGGWNLNTVGASGPYAIQIGAGGWTMTEGSLTAVRIIGK